MPHAAGPSDSAHAAIKYKVGAHSFKSYSIQAPQSGGRLSQHDRLRLLPPGEHDLVEGVQEQIRRFSTRCGPFFRRRPTAALSPSAPTR